MSVQMIPAYVLQVPNWVQPAMRTITIHATREGVETPDHKVCRIYSNVDKNEMAVDMPLRDGIEVSMSFLADAIDGHRAFMLIDSQPNRYGAVRLIDVDSDLNININLVGVAEDTRGNGLLSGSFPLSLLTENNQLPNQAEIRVLYRPTQGEPGDGTVVSTTTCNADGTWQVSGLNENLKFDIVARIPGFNDVIISDVQPTGAPLTAHFAGIKEEYEYEEEVSIQVVALGGKPPYVFEAVSLPDGLSMDTLGNITGNIVGTWGASFNITVTDTENTVITLSADSYVLGDPHWDNVVSLLHFDGDLVDLASGVLGTPTGYISYTPALGRFGSQLRLGEQGRSYIKGGIKEPIGVSDFTIEFRLQLNASQAIGFGGILSIGLRGHENGGMYIRTSGDRNLSLTVSRSDTSLNVPLPIDVPTHIAFVRSSSLLTVYIDGISVYTMNMPQNIHLTDTQIGYSTQDPRHLDGMVDELRITKGVARYTKDFTPPTRAFPNF